MILARRIGLPGLAMALIALSTVASPAGQVAAEVQTPGRVEFDFTDAPSANVEVDLKNGMLSAITNIATAAIEGVAEGLEESSESPVVRMSTDHLNDAKGVVGAASQMIREVRVRVYEDLSDAKTQAAMFDHYQKKLDGPRWENVVRIRQHGENVVVCVYQQESAIRGLFVMVSEGNELVLTNVVCELTPERMKQLTQMATKIGMKFGLEDVIEQGMREIGGPRTQQVSRQTR